MRNRVERLRRWLLGSAGFLVLVIAAFLGTARYLSHLHVKIPIKLGVDVKVDSTGVNLCDTVGPKTVYCVHAAKEIEHTNGKIALHDVSIALYGKNGDRNDRIYGEDFEYDQKAGVVRAIGVVHLDLQAAEAAGASAQPAGPAQAAASGAKVLHATTSGLVYLEKLGVAATSEDIEFQSGAMTGHATGADYSSDTGVLMLHSAVSMSGMAGKRAMQVTAATADLDNRNQEVFLTRARYVSQGQTVETQRATLHTRPDGTLARVEAEGDVTAEANGATEISQRADVQLNAKGQPQSALLTGGVRYASDQPLRQLRGEAQEAQIAFDAQDKPQPNDAVFSGAVHLTERTRATEGAREPWSTRDLTAAKVEARLASAGAGKAQLRDVEATGSTHLVVVNNGSLARTRGQGTTELSADDLKAHLIDAKDARQPLRLDTVAGRGHTLLRQVSADGIEQTSAGDSLDAKFRAWSSASTTSNTAKTRPAGAAVASPSRSGAGSLQGGEGLDELWSALQQGHVSIMRRAPAKSGVKTGNAQEDVEHASAERAAYDGDLDRVTLTGGVQVSDAASVLWAQQVALDRATGDAHAVGAVKVNYLVQNSAQTSGSHAAAPDEPTHILAERADLVHATSVAMFYGRPVRLWQGGSQVQAPVIELSRAQKRLTARGEASQGVSAAMQVHTVLMSAGSGNSSAARVGASRSGSGTQGCEHRPAAKAGAGKSAEGAAETDAQTASLVRIASGGLIYSGDLRQAEFTGGVRAETVDGTIRASEATVYLQPDVGAKQAARPGGASATSGAAGKNAAPAATNVEAGASGTPAVPSLVGELERVVAAGHVELDKPGLHATGTRLVYTASDRIALLTGDSNAPPRAVGAQGTTTGAALRFNSCDDSIEVLGTPGQPARTDARTGKDGGNEKGTR